MTKTKLPRGLVVDKRIRFNVADGYAYYIIKKITARGVWIEWEQNADNPDGYIDQVIGRAGWIRKSVAEAACAFEDGLNASRDDNAEFWANRRLGEILHYKNGRNSWVRCEVCLDDKDPNKKVLMPFELIGDWSDYDLKFNSYHVKTILQCERFQPHFSNLYECRPEWGDPRTMRAVKFQTKPDVLRGNLHIVCGDIKIQYPSQYNTRTGLVLLSPALMKVVEVLKTFLEPIGMVVHCEDGQEYPIATISGSTPNQK